jgi:hypothetical protein
LDNVNEGNPEDDEVSEGCTPAREVGTVDNDSEREGNETQ